MSTEAPLTPDVLAAVVEAYTPEGITIWIRSWLGADPSKRSRMEAGVLAEWSGIAVTEGAGQGPERCTTCGCAFHSPACSLSPETGWSGHTRGGGCAASQEST